MSSKSWTEYLESVAAMPEDQGWHHSKTWTRPSCCSCGPTISTCPYLTIHCFLLNISYQLRADVGQESRPSDYFCLISILTSYTPYAEKLASGVPPTLPFPASMVLSRTVRAYRPQREPRIGALFGVDLAEASPDQRPEASTPDSWNYCSKFLRRINITPGQ